MGIACRDEIGRRRDRRYVETRDGECRDVERIVGVDLFPVELFLVFIDDREGPVAVPVPDVDQHLVLVARRIKSLMT